MGFLGCGVEGIGLGGIDNAVPNAGSSSVILEFVVRISNSFNGNAHTLAERKGENSYERRKNGGLLSQRTVV